MARKDTWGYRTTKFVRRNRAIVGAGVITFAVLVAGVVATTWQARVARAERARAEQRFGDVRQLAHAFLFDFHDSIADLEGSTPARKLVVTKGLEYLDRLASDAGDRVDLRREIAGRLRQGRRRPGPPVHAQSRRHRRRARQLSQGDRALRIDHRRRRRRLGRRPQRRELALAYVHLSDVLAAAGKTAESLSFAQKALAIERELSSDPTDSPEARRALVASYSRVGDMLAASGNVTAALEHRRTALAIMESVAAAAPQDPANIRQLGVAYQKLGNTLGNPNAPNVGDTAGALAALERSAEIFRNASAQFPSNAMFRRNHAVAESNAADVLFAMKRVDEALVRERRSLAVYEAQAAADPANAAAQNDLAIGYSKMAQLLDATGQTAAGLASQQRATDIHRRLVAADPRSSDMKQELARTTTARRRCRRRSGCASCRSPTTPAPWTSAASCRRPTRATTSCASRSRWPRPSAPTRMSASRGRRRGPARAADLAAAEADYGAALAIYQELQQAGTFAASDTSYVDHARAQLASIRAERAAIEVGRSAPNRALPSSKAEDGC